MGSKIMFGLAISLVIIGLASADLAQDRTECASQLEGLATCLPYVSGSSKAPTVDCCSGLKQVLQKSQKCLCILIKDRDDPNLGLKINGTLAAILPNTCHVPSNVSDCINLLHLSPTSPDAKMFEEFANVTKGSGTGTSAPVPSTSGNSTAASSGAGGSFRTNTWPSSSLPITIYGFLLLWAFTSLVS